MDSLKNAEDLIKPFQEMYDNHQKLVNSRLSEVESDESASEEDKTLFKSMHTQINKAMKDGNISGLNSIITELTNKMTK